ncbi:MAG: hypothetical protein ACK5NA_05745 [Enterococcus sp.]
MYVVKVMHGYIDKEGRRTREKDPAKLLIFHEKEQSESFAQKIGGRSKALAEMRRD